MGALLAAKKKDVTQVLELPKELPAAVAAPTRNLIFHISPLSAKGLLSQQTRDALKAILKLNNGAPIAAIRAFVAGSGDMRRVSAIVSETLSDKKMPLPAVSVVQTGGLQLEGAQVVLESVSVAKRETNPNGLIFLSGRAASSDETATLPLAEKSLSALDVSLPGAAADVLRITCFTTSRNEEAAIQTMAGKRYPNAAIDIVEAQRALPRAAVQCEAVARLAQARTQPLEFLNGGQAAAVSATKIAFTGAQMAFGFEDKDARLAFQRLDKALEPLGASTKTAAMAHFYPLSNSIAEQVKRIRLEFFDPSRLPASTLLSFEGLPAMEASFAVDVVAVINQ